MTVNIVSYIPPLCVKSLVEFEPFMRAAVYKMYELPATSLSYRGSYLRMAVMIKKDNVHYIVKYALPLQHVTTEYVDKNGCKGKKITIQLASHHRLQYYLYDHTEPNFSTARTSLLERFFAWKKKKHSKDELPVETLFSDYLDELNTNCQKRTDKKVEEFLRMFIDNLRMTGWLNGGFDLPVINTENY